MKKNIIYSGLLLLCLLSFTRCESYFDTKTDDALSGNDYIGSINELYSGYMGIAAKVQAVADQPIFLSELRGDLLEPTANAPQELWDIYNHNDLNGNSYADPKGYYAIIIGANDYIKKAYDYKTKNPNAVEDGIYKPLVSMAIRYKVWAYLMLAKIYGEAAYFDEPLTNYSDIKNYEKLGLSEIIQKCLTLMESGMYNINGKQTLTWSTILAQGQTTSADLTWDMICPTPEALLIELNLWAGNYQKVVDLAIPYIYDNGSTGKRYKLSNSDYNGEWCQFFYASPVTKTKELMTIVPFDYANHQTNRLISYFSNTYPCKYYLRPTQAAMNRFNSQTQFDGATPTDVYRGNNYTFIKQNGDWVIRKFTRNRETADLIYKNDVHICLYRAADIHLFLAEALNQLQLFPEAEAFLNDGVETYLSKFAGALRAPLNNPVYNAALSINWGIRRRVNLSPAVSSKSFVSGTTIADNFATPEARLAYQKAFDKALVEETCMESAGEARSYFAMVRVAKRWNDPSILADRVSAKYSSGMKESIHNLLMNPDNWFVSYKLD